MNTVVFAYHDMGCVCINALLASGYRISAIFTHADTPGENPFFLAQWLVLPPERVFLSIHRKT